MARRRHRRFNAWFGAPLLHKRAARRGWGRRKARRSRRNAGSLSLGGISRAATAGYRVNVLKKAGTILVGNIGTTWIAGQIQNFLPILRNNRILDTLTVLSTAGLASFVTRRIRPIGKVLHPDSVFIGGILAGVTRGLKNFAPGILPSSCLGEDMDGLGDWFINPGLVNSAFPLHGLGYAPGPGTPIVGTHGIGDHAMHWQTQPGSVVQLDGLDAVGEEIASQM